MASATSALTLRLVVLSGGRIVEERALLRPRDVSLGQSARCTLSVPGVDSLPRRVRLFTRTRDGYRLHLQPGMDAQLAVGDAIVAVRPDEARLVALGVRARGRVTVGEVMVVFQLLPAVPISRPQLPPSVRGSLWRSIDRLLALIVGASFLVHFGCVGYLRTIDRPRQPDVEALPDSFPRVTTRLYFPPAHKADVPKVVEKLPPARGPHGDRNTGNGPARDPAATARTQAVRRAELAAAIQRSGMIKLLTGKGDDGTPLADVLRRGDASTDADRVFAQVNGLRVEQASNRLLPRGGGTPRALRESAALRPDGPARVALADRGSERRIELATTAPIDLEGAAPPDPLTLANEIHRRLGGIKACYESALRHNPSLDGKLQLHVAVTSAGLVSTVGIEWDSLRDPEVIDCIRTRVRAWRLPPAQSAFEFTYPFVFVAK